MAENSFDELNAEAERDRSIGGIVLAREGLVNNVRKLSKVNDLHFLWTVTYEWAIIALSIAAAVWTGSLLVYILAFIIISTRQHALAILMHDGTHFRCLNNRTANNIVCDLLCAFPLNMTTSRYRYEHLCHHRFLNTDKDYYWQDFDKYSDWHWPKTKSQAIWVFIKDLLGINLKDMLPVLYRWSPWINHFSTKESPSPLGKGERIRLYLFLITVAAVLTITGGWFVFFVLWLLPLSTLTMALMRMRTIAEHLGIPNKDELDASRHIDGTFLERQAFAPHNINYHIGHHLFPSVPYYNLPKLHELLLKNNYFKEHAIIKRTYLGRDKDGLLGDIII